MKIKGVKLNKRILVVEDDYDVRSNICELLLLEKYEVISAEGGKEALEKMNKALPDLIISDIEMPEMNGYEFIKELQTRKETRLIPFIFLTGVEGRKTQRVSMTLGADDFISKPFENDDLLDAVKMRFEKQKAYFKILEEMKINITKSVPHELRTPLTGIISNSDMLLNYFEELTTTDFKDTLRSIKKSGLRIFEWVEKFELYIDVSTRFDLYSNKIEHTKSESVKIDSLDLNNHFKLNYNWDSRRNDINTNFENAEIKISMEDLDFIIRELIENAAKFSEPNSQIFGKGEVVNNNYIITVSDRGKGFSDTAVSHIKTFRQLERKGNDQHGNGFGLTIIHKMVEMRGGSLKIDSKINDYSNVIISLPLEPID